ncbi:MAG: complex I 51 kDa subunit family protein [Planctomycetota bacterium]|jgi:NADH:ubiquinone oxidoreductase subunit F (NADH-binding)
MIKETKVLTERVGTYEVEDIHAYEKAGGLQGLGRALSMKPGEVVDEVKCSGLTGRGGAGFGTGVKWEFAAGEEAFPKYLICNADEGELGTHKDRVLLEGDPWSVLEGMLISAYAIGAEEAYIYIKGEYADTIQLWAKILDKAQETGLLGDSVLGSSFSLRIRIAKGRGLYVAGEELALISSLELRRPMSRLKPPYPSERGLFGQPTVVNNVETLANVPVIMSKGAAAYSQLGDKNDRGTRLFSLSGDVKNPGVYELALGSATLAELIEDLGGGTIDGRGIKAVQPGGGTSALLTGDSLGCTLTTEAIREAGSNIGTGGVIVYDQRRSGVEIVGGLLDFYGKESCGRCLPCRMGTMKMHEIAGRLRGGGGTAEDLVQLGEIGRVCASTTLCGFGQTVAIPVLSAMELFGGDFETCVRGRTIPTA